MKYLFLVMAAASFVACNVTDKKPVTDKPTQVKDVSSQDSTKFTTIQWIDSITQSLGTITQGQVVEVSWRFKNTGSLPLTIEDVHASCGCTIPDRPTAPIAPGAEGLIKAKFNSEGKSGFVTKDVLVNANNSNRNNGGDNKLTFTATIKDK